MILRRAVLGFSCLAAPHTSVYWRKTNDVLRLVFRRLTPGAAWPPSASAAAAAGWRARLPEECEHFDPGVAYPEYYLADFHAYTGGNLNPRAAREAASATRAVMDHHFEHLTGEESSHFIRQVHSVLTRAASVQNTRDGRRRSVVDFGCGIGVSTSYLRDSFRGGDVVGIDLSPFFLDETGGVDARFVHGDVERTGLETGSVDVVSISFVLHELPYDVSVRVLEEAHRVLRPGTGVLSILDMDRPRPSSPIMRLIFGRTEPFLEEFSRLTLPRLSADLEKTGFRKVQLVEGFPKTIMVLGSKSGSRPDRKRSV